MENPHYTLKTREGTEELIQFFGERYRPMIISAIKFLDINEPKWNLAKPIDRRLYIQKLLNNYDT